jgi:hypothetical protein
VRDRSLLEVTALGPPCAHSRIRVEDASGNVPWYRRNESNSARLPRLRYHVRGVWLDTALGIHTVWPRPSSRYCPTTLPSVGMSSGSTERSTSTR